MTQCDYYEALIRIAVLWPYMSFTGLEIRQAKEDQVDKFGISILAGEFYVVIPDHITYYPLARLSRQSIEALAHIFLSPSPPLRQIGDKLIEIARAQAEAAEARVQEAIKVLDEA